MRKIALIGKDIGYTYSPGIHAAIIEAIGADAVFEVEDIPYDMLEGTVDRLVKTHVGFFVTKPYKLAVKAFVKSDDGPVNLVRSCDRTGHNTDGIGFLRALDKSFGSWHSDVSAALVLGAGGAARAVVGALTAQGKAVYVLDRTLMNAARLVAEYSGAELYVNQPAQLIVNCTDVGRNGEDALAALCVLPDFEYAFDLVYGNVDTPFLRRNRIGGARQVADGTDMLIYQAIEGDKILLEAEFDTEKVFDTVKQKIYG